MHCCWPSNAILVDGDGVRARALAHAVQLLHRDAEAHEVVQSIFGDGSGSSAGQLAAVQTQLATNLLKHQIVGQHEAPRHLVLPAAKQTQSVPMSRRVQIYSCLITSVTL